MTDFVIPHNIDEATGIYYKIGDRINIAELLGIKPTTLASQMNSLGIENSK